MSVVYTVTAAALTSNVATLLLDRVSGLEVGYKVHVVGLASTFNGEHTLTVVDRELSEVKYAKNHANIAKADVFGQLRLEVTWIDANDVLPFLGTMPASEADIEWLEDAVDATNVWCYERRQAAGYVDLPNHVPTPRVRSGVIMKAAEEYRSRGSIDQYASFQQLDAAAPIQSNAEILRLLGLNKPAVA